MVQPIIVDDNAAQEVVELIRQPSTLSFVTKGKARKAEKSSHSRPENSSNNNNNIMPPAPFHQASPASIGEEEGMEALWVEELVSPGVDEGGSEEETDTIPKLGANTSTAPSRRSSFFKRRNGTGPLWKRHAKDQATVVNAENVYDSSTTTPEKTSRPRKVRTGIKLLDDNENEEEVTRQFPAATKSQPTNVHETSEPISMEQRQSSFGQAEEEDERESGEPESTPVPPIQQAKSASTFQSETSKQISVKSALARKLLAKALDKDTEVTEIEGLAQAAFAEATAARMILEGSNAPKGLDLVLRAASHKGRSATMAAAFSPENVEQQARARHYMDLIVPIEVTQFPAGMTPEAVSRSTRELATPRTQDGDLSTLGFDNTFSVDSPRHATTATGGASGPASPMSMSSLNEILDEPEEMRNTKPEQADESTVKYRLPFFKKKNSPFKQDPPEKGPFRDALNDREMPPPVDAPSMDDGASWTDASFDEANADVVESKNSSSSSQTTTRKKKRVFRLARLAGLAGTGAAVAASSSGSARTSDRGGWLRRKKTKDVDAENSESSDDQLVDQVPTSPPNVPYQSNPYQRYNANVNVDTGSRTTKRSGDSKEISTVAALIRDIDIETNERIQMALMADDTEALTSFDGVKMFGQNEKTEEELQAEAESPDEIPTIESALSSLSKRSVKLDPEFHAAPRATDSKLLISKSWDSIIDDHAAVIQDRPLSTMRALLDVDEMGGSPYDGRITAVMKSRGPPPDHYDLMPSSSPASFDSDTPDLLDKYQSAEDTFADDKYFEGDMVEGKHSFDGQATVEEDYQRYEEDDFEPEEDTVPNTPRRMGLIARIQNRRRNQDTEARDAGMINEDQMAIQTAETETTKEESRKTPRRKLKIFKKFQCKKKQSEDHLAEGEDFYGENTKENLTSAMGDLALQATGTMTDVENSNTQDVEDEDSQPVVRSPVAAHQGNRNYIEDVDPLISNIRRHSGRVKRGIDPVTHASAEYARGIDP